MTVVPSGRTRIFIRPGPTISPIPRFFGSNDSLDYGNRWRTPHAEPPSHGDRKSCSTRREICTPAATPSITRIAGGAHTRSRPVTAIGSRVQLDARSAPQVVDMGARTSPI
ncbi:hypothetical protein Taro_022241 [Colocasia esculenta]|uniref:Uncharacterized protein n=1 Tax=Colocasia esculenta TaxID=4460 RepID=A0A843VDW4_COLES|nr:hypothetical protein [Colocasia esculenta]